MQGWPRLLARRLPVRAAATAAVALLVATAAAAATPAAAATADAAGEPPVAYRTLRFPPPYVPGYGGVSELCWLQCPLSNKNAASARFGSTITIRGGMCAAALDAGMLPGQYHLDDERLGETLAVAWARDGPALAGRVSASVRSVPAAGRDRPCRPVTDAAGGAYSYVDEGVDGRGDTISGSVVLGRDDPNATVPDPTGDSGGGLRASA